MLLLLLLVHVGRSSTANRHAIQARPSCSGTQAAAAAAAAAQT
jgi:hypothetical protein